jgi:hypothetical protein
MGVRVKCNELVEADVKFVSLVERGANRIPFRILKHDKGEEGMNIDLKRLFKFDQPKSVLSSVYVKDGVNLEVIRRKMEKAGLSVELMEQHDGGVVFKQEEAKDEVLVRLSDDVIVGCSNAKKYFQGYDFQSTEFAEVYAKESVLPTLNLMVGALHDTLGNILDTVETVADARNKMSKAIADFSTVAVNVLNNLPDDVFKLEKILREADEVEKQEEPVDIVTEDVVKEEEAATVDVPGDAVAKADDLVEAVEEGKQAEEEAFEVVGAEVEKSESDPEVMSEVLSKEEVSKMIQDFIEEKMNSFMETLTQKLEGITEAVNLKVQEMKSEVDRVSQKMETTVFGVSRGDTELSRKNESQPSTTPRMIDTAFAKFSKH